MIHISLYPLPGSNEVSADVMVGDQYHASCSWRSPNMHIPLPSSKPLLILFLVLFSLFFGGVGSSCSCLLIGCYCVIRSEISITLVLGSSLNSFQVIFKEKFSVRMRIFCTLCRCVLWMRQLMGVPNQYSNPGKTVWISQLYAELALHAFEVFLSM
jgi:hypothetical protein